VDSETDWFYGIRYERLDHLLNQIKNKGD